MRYLSDDEARRIVNAGEPEFRPIVQASLLTGVRWGELRRITKRDVDLRSGTVWLQETKGAEPRPCYLEKEGLALFTIQCQHLETFIEPMCSVAIARLSRR